MITPEMVDFAMSHSHDNCKNGCIHADAFSVHTDRIRQFLAEEVIICNAHDADAIFQLFWIGVHVGYCLAKMPENTSTEKIQ